VASPALGIPPPLALYIHFPWCLHKCPYCDFNSQSLPAAADEGAYVQALLRDLAWEAEGVRGREVQTVFIGGGTPSLLSGAAVATLLEGVARRVTLAAGAEITLEANPGAAEAGRFRAYRAAGVNRLSIGVQSFDEAKLRALGRIHDRHEALRAVALARQAGFDNLNLDLMFGLPDQGLGQALADVQTAIELAPEHLSYYQLTLEPQTVFHHQPPPLPPDDTLEEIEFQGQAALRQAGYRHYEVSAFARPGRECRHNLNYWQFGDYLGIGAGAHGKITSGERIERRWRLRGAEAFMQQAGGTEVLEGACVLDETDRVAEFMLNALRLRDGFAETLFAGRTGLPLARIEPLLAEAVGRGLLGRHAGWIAPTEPGQRFLNDLIAVFLPEPTP
jgi:putative oxygen-independent coproporphyrinogen III oxidase